MLIKEDIMTTSVDVHIELKPFTHQESYKLVESVAKSKTISNKLLEFLSGKSGGLPIYVHLLSLYLLEAGFFEGSDNTIEEFFQDEDRVAESIRKFVATNHPLMDVIDALSPSSHLTLKVIATIKYNAHVELISQVYPHAINVEAIEKDIEELQNTGIFIITLKYNKILINFSCEMTRDIIYALIPQEQRRRFHKKLAKILRDYSSTDSSTLAYHWTKSVLGIEVIEWRKTMKAIDLWESAIEQDLDNNNRKGVVKSLENIIELQGILENFYSKIKSPKDVIDGNIGVNSVELSNLSMRQRLFFLRRRTSSHNTDEANSGYILENTPYISPLKLAIAHRTMSDLISKNIECKNNKPTDCIANKQSSSSSVKYHLLSSLYYLGLPSIEDSRWRNKALANKRRIINNFGNKVKGWFKSTIKKKYDQQSWKLPMRRRPSMSQFIKSHHHGNKNPKLRMMTRIETKEAITCVMRLRDYAVENKDWEIMTYCEDLVSLFLEGNSIICSTIEMKKKLGLKIHHDP